MFPWFLSERRTTARIRKLRNSGAVYVHLNLSLQAGSVVTTLNGEQVVFLRASHPINFVMGEDACRRGRLRSVRSVARFDPISYTSDRKSNWVSARSA